MAVQEVSDLDFPNAIEKSPKVVVKYFADWCGQCKLFAPKFKRLSNDDKYSNITFLEVNAENNPESRKLASVNNLPFFAIFVNGIFTEGTSTAKEENVVALIEKLN